LKRLIKTLAESFSSISAFAEMSSKPQLKLLKGKSHCFSYKTGLLQSQKDIIYVEKNKY
jgi:hypothetical protein